jgi:hypothetical protein
MLWCLSAFALAASPVPAETRQLVLVIVEDSSRSDAELRRYHRDAAGPWVRDGAGVPTRVAGKGVA